MRPDQREGGDEPRGRRGDGGGTDRGHPGDDEHPAGAPVTREGVDGQGRGDEQDGEPDQQRSPPVRAAGAHQREAVSADRSEQAARRVQDGQDRDEKEGGHRGGDRRTGPGVAQGQAHRCCHGDREA